MSKEFFTGAMGLHDLLLADLLPTIHASADRLPQVGNMEETMPLCQLKEFFFFEMWRSF
jgi:hypothetical protein